MTLHIAFGWWLAPAIVTLGLLAAWRIWGVRMQPNRGHLFPDIGGALFELCGYLGAGLVSAFAWLIWALLT